MPPSDPGCGTGSGSALLGIGANVAASCSASDGVGCAFRERKYRPTITPTTKITAAAERPSSTIFSERLSSLSTGAGGCTEPAEATTAVELGESEAGLSVTSGGIAGFCSSTGVAGLSSLALADAPDDAGCGASDESAAGAACCGVALGSVPGCETPMVGACGLALIGPESLAASGCTTAALGLGLAGSAAVLSPDSRAGSRLGLAGLLLVSAPTRVSVSGSADRSASGGAFAWSAAGVEGSSEPAAGAGVTGAWTDGGSVGGV